MHTTLYEKTIGFVGRQHLAFKINIIKNMLVNFSIGLTQQYQSIYVYSLGATALELGYVNSIGGVTNTILSVPVGLLADRHGIKKMMFISLSLMALGYAIFGSATNWQTIALALISVSVANLIQMNVCPMVCGSCLRSVERTTGMQICDTVAAIPRLFAPVMAAFAIAAYGGLNTEGIRPLYWFEVAGIIIALLIVTRYFVNPPGTGETKDASFSSGARRVTTEGVHIKRWIVYYMLMNIPWTMGFYIPLYANLIRGASPLLLGLMDSGYWFASVLLALPIGIASDRFGRKRMIAALAPLYGLGLMILCNIPGDYALLVAGVLNGFTMLMGVTESSITVELVPKDLLGAWFGLLGLFTGVVGFVAPILGGILWNNLGPATVLYFLAATQVVKLGILATMPSKSKYS